MTNETRSVSPRPVSTEVPAGTIALATSLEAFERATGTRNPDLQSNLLLQLSNALWLPDGLDEESRSSRVHAAKLLAIYARQIEALDKHRGKGQQTMTVEQVNVEAGGQAIVGHVETGSPAGRGAGDANPAR